MENIESFLGLTSEDEQYKVSRSSRVVKNFHEEEKKLLDILINENHIEYLTSWLHQVQHIFESKFATCFQLLNLIHQESYRKVKPCDDRTLQAQCDLTLHSSQFNDPLSIKGRSEFYQGLKDRTIHELQSFIESIEKILGQDGFNDSIRTKMKLLIKELRDEEQDTISHGDANFLFSPSELRILHNVVLTELRLDYLKNRAYVDLERYETAVMDITPDLVNCEALLEAATLNGDVALAEDIAQNQLTTYERLLMLAWEQYPLMKHHNHTIDNAQRLRRWSIFRLAAANIGSIETARERVIQLCSEDKNKLLQKIRNLEQDQQKAVETHDLFLKTSDEQLEGNRFLIQKVLNRAKDLIGEFKKCHKEIIRLSAEREQNIEVRLDTERQAAEQTAVRCTLTQQAKSMLQRLNLTVAHAEKGKYMCEKIRRLLSDSCQNVSDMIDMHQKQINILSFRVQKNIWARATEFYLALGRVKYHKNQKLVLMNEDLQNAKMQAEIASDSLDFSAKKYILKAKQLEEQGSKLKAEVSILDTKMQEVSNRLNVLMPQLKEHGENVIHPSVLLSKINHERKERNLENRSVLLDLMNSEQNIVREEHRLTVDTMSYEKRIREHRAQKSSLRKKIELMAKVPFPLTGPIDNAPTECLNTSSEGFHTTPESCGINEIAQKSLKGTCLAKKYQSTSILQFLEYRERVESNSEFLYKQQEKVPDRSGTEANPSMEMKDSPTSVTETKCTLSTKECEFIRPHKPLLEKLTLNISAPANKSSDSTRFAQRVRQQMFSKPEQLNRFVCPGKVCMAIFSYSAQQPDELSFQKGDHIICIAAAEDANFVAEEGWYLGALRDRKGIFPLNYVTVEQD